MYDKKSIRKKILSIMLPMALEGLLQVLTSIVSSAMVGRLTISSISAQGISNKLTDIIFFVFRGIGVGLTIMVSQKHAKGENTDCKLSFEQTLTSMMMVTLAVMGLFYFASAPLLSIFSKDNTALIEYAVPYFRLALIGFLGMCIVNISASFYQGLGDTVTPMKIAVVMNVVNVICGFMLIFGKFGAPELGYLGASISIAVSRTVGAIIYIILLYKKNGKMEKMECSRKYCLMLEKRRLAGVYTLGVPAAGENLNWHVGSILLSIIVMQYGEEFFSAYQLGLQAEMITEVPANGFSVAATSLIAASFGLQDKELFKSYEREIKKICFAITLCTSCILFFKAKFMMSLLTDKPELIKIGMTYVMTMGLIQIPQNLYKVNCGIIRSAGFKTAPFELHMAGTWLIRMPGAFICGVILKRSITWIWAFMALDQVSKYIMSGAIKKHKHIEDKFEEYAQRVA